LPVVSALKDAYTLWQSYFIHLPKTAKYTIGEKIDKFLLESLESACSAGFLSGQEKIPFVRLSIKKLDMVKIFLQIAWEIKALDTNKYCTLSVKLDEVGRMLGGWHGQLIKQNSPQ
jgi:hypothetical protein